MTISGKQITVLSTQIKATKVNSSYKGDKMLWKAEVTYIIDEEFYTVSRHAKTKSDCKIKVLNSAWLEAVRRVEKES